MKAALVKRGMLLALCGVAMAGIGYRARVVAVAAIQRPIAPTTTNGRHNDDARAAASVSKKTAKADETQKKAKADKSAAPLTNDARLASLRKPLSLESSHNPFAASSWLPPPPPVEVQPVAEVRPAPPTAPPVPFAYVGELDSKAAKPQVFLSKADQLLIVSPGDVIDGQYRVESISEADVVLTYLPLSEKQVITIPSEGK
ncbi:MAG TPA: hypothetical protein VGZ01_05610 [Trinickia sp.]|nr:hypothetical protein [Trinickia sp.]